MQPEAFRRFISTRAEGFSAIEGCRPVKYAAFLQPFHQFRARARRLRLQNSLFDDFIKCPQKPANLLHAHSPTLQVERAPLFKSELRQPDRTFHPPEQPFNQSTSSITLPALMR